MMYETDLPLRVKTFYKNTKELDIIKVPSTLDSASVQCYYSIRNIPYHSQIVTKFQADIIDGRVVIPNSLLDQLASGYYNLLLVFYLQNTVVQFEELKLHIKDL